ncbi:phasin family protein [Alkalicoccus daliensis]|uniref:Polyhydroxyalkanoate synthesis regulator phasin n=1 Tax=Alkalicoccus daliensis TaxID=745820 RepID=A0A1H0IBQ4_9BACI|nr:hypothetical protein [Alkalicoccus daliensis]SDO28822.1 Polyhydroxyalkanoate synthesis regulator phasin [Alkalicoccus daliensis]
MANLLKTGFLLGLGAAVSSKEKVDRYVDDLLAKGKVTPAEADELYQNFLKRGEETEQDWNRRSKERVRDFLKDFDLVTKEEHDALKVQLEALENRLSALENQQHRDI